MAQGLFVTRSAWSSDLCSFEADIMLESGQTLSAKVRFDEWCDKNEIHITEDADEEWVQRFEEEFRDEVGQLLADKISSELRKRHIFIDDTTAGLVSQQALEVAKVEETSERIIVCLDFAALRKERGEYLKYGKIAIDVEDDELDNDNVAYTVFNDQDEAVIFEDQCFCDFIGVDDGKLMFGNFLRQTPSDSILCLTEDEAKIAGVDVPNILQRLTANVLGTDKPSKANRGEERC